MHNRSVLLQLTAVPHAARGARHAARAVLEDWGIGAGVVDDAELVISELVTNAVQHTGSEGTFELQIAQSGDVLRVALTDGSTQQPRLRRPRTTTEEGRGLRILAALADRWGMDPTAGGKQVWWEVDLVQAAPTARRATATASA